LLFLAQDSSSCYYSLTTMASLPSCKGADGKGCKGVNGEACWVTYSALEQNKNDTEWVKDGKCNTCGHHVSDHYDPVAGKISCSSYPFCTLLCVSCCAVLRHSLLLPLITTSTLFVSLFPCAPFLRPQAQVRCVWLSQMSALLFLVSCLLFCCLCPMLVSFRKLLLLYVLYAVSCVCA